MIFCRVPGRTGTWTQRPLFMSGRFRTTGLSGGRSCRPRPPLLLQKIKWKPALSQNVCIRTMCFLPFSYRIAGRLVAVAAIYRHPVRDSWCFRYRMIVLEKWRPWKKNRMICSGRSTALALKNSAQELNLKTLSSLKSQNFKSGIRENLRIWNICGRIFPIS